MSEADAGGVRGLRPEGGEEDAFRRRIVSERLEIRRPRKNVGRIILGRDRRVGLAPEQSLVRLRELGDSGDGLRSGVDARGSAVRECRRTWIGGCRRAPRSMMPPPVLDEQEFGPGRVGEGVGEGFDRPGTAGGVGDVSDMPFLDQQRGDVARQASSLPVGNAKGHVERLHGQCVRAAGPGGERGNGGPQQVGPRVVPGHHRRRGDGMDLRGPPGLRPGQVRDPRPQQAGHPELGHRRELVVGRGQAQRDQTEGLMQRVTSAFEFSEVVHAGREDEADLGGLPGPPQCAVVPSATSAPMPRSIATAAMSRITASTADPGLDDPVRSSRPTGSAPNEPPSAGRTPRRCRTSENACAACTSVVDAGRTEHDWKGVEGNTAQRPAQHSGVGTRSAHRQPDRCRFVFPFLEQVVGGGAGIRDHDVWANGPARCGSAAAIVQRQRPSRKPQRRDGHALDRGRRQRRPDLVVRTVRAQPLRLSQHLR